MDKEVYGKPVTADAARMFKALGCQVEEVVNPGFPRSRDIHVPLWLGGLAGMLGSLLPTWEEQMDPMLVSWTKIGLDLSAADFVRAQIRRNELRDAVRRFFQNYDLLITPSLPVTAFRADVSAREALEATGVDYRNWSPFSPIFNLTHAPAASIPAGFTRDGLPVGLQIVGPRFADLLVLQASAAFEAFRPWGDVKPDLAAQSNGFVQRLRSGCRPSRSHSPFRPPTAPTCRNNHPPPVKMFVTLSVKSRSLTARRPLDLRSVRCTTGATLWQVPDPVSQVTTRRR